MEVMILLHHWLEATHSVRTWHDNPWPWVSLTWLLHNLQLRRHGQWFRKLTVRFRPIRKELVQCIMITKSSSSHASNQNLAHPCGLKTNLYPREVFCTGVAQGKNCQHVQHEEIENFFSDIFHCGSKFSAMFPYIRHWKIEDLPHWGFKVVFVTGATRKKSGTFSRSSRWYQRVATKFSPVCFSQIYNSHCKFSKSSCPLLIINVLYYGISCRNRKKIEVKSSLCSMRSTLLCQAFLFGVGCCFGQGDSHVLSRLPGKQGLHAAEFNDSSDSYETTPERKCSGQLFRVMLIK